jgi:hypothetical protein
LARGIPRIARANILEQESADFIGFLLRFLYYCGNLFLRASRRNILLCVNLELSGHPLSYEHRIPVVHGIYDIQYIQLGFSSGKLSPFGLNICKGNYIPPREILQYGNKNCGVFVVHRMICGKFTVFSFTYIGLFTQLIDGVVGS